MHHIHKLQLLMATLISLNVPCSVAAGPQDAERLGGELTPLGGETAGNKEGTIPQWSGAEPPMTGWIQGKKRVDFWKHKDEKPLLSIDSSNVEKYASKLSPGQLQLFKELKGYRMDVYKTHRTCGVPDFVAANTKKNVGVAKVAPEGWFLKEAVLPGTPFPFPQSGVEAMLNGKFYYRGVLADYKAVVTAASPRKGGGDWIKAIDEASFFYPWANKGSTLLSSLPPVEVNLFFTYSSPPALAGQGVNTTVRMNEPGSETFYYFPGQRRVRRMPSYAYDAPQIGFENQYTMDEVTMFFGTMDRFDWKLVGKKEMYVPYNSFGAYNFDGKFEEFAQESFINPAARRYELHRVWVVEATVKAGVRHTSSKRTYYLDEDSWSYLAAEDYDGQGKIWKVRESFPIPVYELGGACTGSAFVQYNVMDGRYVVDTGVVGIGTDAKWQMEASGPRTNINFYTAENLRAISDR